MPTNGLGSWMKTALATRAQICILSCQIAWLSLNLSYLSARRDFYNWLNYTIRF